jgi:hypothetical protein
MTEEQREYHREAVRAHRRRKREALAEEMLRLNPWLRDLPSVEDVARNLPALAWRRRQ